MSDVAAELKAVIRDQAATFKNWRGRDWWELSEEEEYVFDIKADRFPLMITTLEAYEVLIGMVDGSSMDAHEAVFDAAKAARPDIVAMGWGLESFVAFVTAFTEISYREAWQIFHKNEAWKLRQDILFFPDKET
jgi:hypothetical protein